MSGEILQYLEDEKETQENDVAITLEGSEESVDALLGNNQQTNEEYEDSSNKNFRYKVAAAGFAAGFAATASEAANAMDYISRDADKFMEYAPKALEAASSFGEIGGAVATGLGALYCYSRIERR